MNILCSCDNKYAPFAGVMLTSLFENHLDYEKNGGRRIVVYLIEIELSDDNKQMLLSLVLRYSAEINFISVSPSLLENFPIKESDHISLSTYLRLFCSEYLPDNVDRVLYLDCDVIINSDLTAFYFSDLSDCSLLAVCDEDFYNEEQKNIRLYLNTAYKYINAGVLLINLSRWRECKFSQQVVQFVKTTSLDLSFHDQDIINVLLCKSINYAHIKYNFQTGFILKSKFDNYSPQMQEIIINTAKSPAIIHYTWIIKPWAIPSTHPYASLFDKYARKSGIPNKHIYYRINKPIKQKFFYFLVWLGILKNKRTYIIGRL